MESTLKGALAAKGQEQNGGYFHRKGALEALAVTYNWDFNLNVGLIVLIDIFLKEYKMQSLKSITTSCIYLVLTAVNTVNIIYSTNTLYERGILSLINMQTLVNR